MRLGMSLPFQHPDGTAPSAAEVMARAKLIEDMGFDGIWFGETIGRTETPRPDPLVWLAVAAAGTQSIELGTAVLQLPLRYPVEFAQRLMTLYALSGGRFRAGLGAGSTKADFDAVGVDFDSRFKVFDAGLKTVRRLLKGEEVGEANLRPWPNALGGPPIYIGAWESGLWVKRAAEQYDGWQASGRTTFKALREGIKSFRDAGGKRALVATVTIDLSKPEGRLDEDANFSLACGPESASERLHLLEEMGYDDVLMVRSNHTAEEITEADLRAYRALSPKQA